ncbi:MAG: hypothetical protein ACRCSN_12510 [Dermatophilaceae bacterium]
MKVYTATAEEFFIPLRALSEDPRRLFANEVFWHESFVAAFTQELLRNLPSDADIGIRLYRDEVFGPVIRIAERPGVTWEPQPSPSPMVFAWKHIRLNEAQARLLQRRLIEAFVEAVQGSGDGDPQYIVGVHMVRDPD